MKRLEGKSALVFGADPITSGIATRYLNEGANVAVVDTAAALKGFADGASVHEAADYGPGAIGDAVRKALGGKSLDILVIGGGDLPEERDWKGIDDVDPAAMGETIEKPAAAVLAAVQAAGEGLKKQGGAIIFVFNPAGLYSESGWGDGAMLHHAKRGLARTLAMEGGQYQVRVNTLVPLADTPGFQAYRARNPQQVDWRVSKTAMQRVGDPVKDIGGAAVFLGTSDTRYLTGSMIFADGGNFLGLPVIETSVPAA